MHINYANAIDSIAGDCRLQAKGECGFFGIYVSIYSFAFCLPWTLAKDSPQYREVREAGWDVAEDRWECRLRQAKPTLAL